MTNDASQATELPRQQLNADISKRDSRAGPVIFQWDRQANEVHAKSIASLASAIRLEASNSATTRSTSADESRSGDHETGAPKQGAPHQGHDSAAAADPLHSRTLPHHHEIAAMLNGFTLNSEADGRQSDGRVKTNFAAREETAHGAVRKSNGEHPSDVILAASGKQQATNDRTGSPEAPGLHPRDTASSPTDKEEPLKPPLGFSPYAKDRVLGWGVSKQRRLHAQSSVFQGRWRHSRCF